MFCVVYFSVFHRVRSEERERGLSAIHCAPVLVLHCAISRFRFLIIIFTPHCSYYANNQNNMNMVYIRNGEIFRSSAPKTGEQQQLFSRNYPKSTLRDHSRFCTYVLNSRKINTEDDAISVASTVPLEEEAVCFIGSIAKGLGIEDLLIRIPKFVCFGIDEVVTIPFVYVVLVCILYLFFGYRSFVFGALLLLGFLSAKASEASATTPTSLLQEDSKMPPCYAR